MRSRAAVVLACGLLFATAACNDHSKKVSATAPLTSAVASARPTPAPEGVPRVLLQIGTSYQRGSLARYCRGSSCTTGTATPPSALKATDPLLFIVDRKPRSATVRLTRGTATAAQRALHVGTTMVYAPDVGAGTYVVHLDAVWSDRSVSWVFQIAVPKT